MIVSRDNQRLKDIRRLKACKEAGRALLEGPHLIADAIAAGLDLDYVLATPDFSETGPGHELARLLPEPALVVETRLLEEVADADAPRGVVAAVSFPEAGIDRLPGRLAGPLVFAEGIQDPGNLGALARTAEAAGASGLAISPGRHGSASPRHPRALRGSAGSLLRIPLASGTTLGELEQRYSEQRPRSVALVAHGGVDLDRADLDRPLILALGAEAHGLSPATLAGCDLQVTIPLAAPVESLNTAVAAAVALFEIRRRNS